MKNNKILIIIGVILLNVLAVFTVASALSGKASEYDLALAEARELYGKELCSRAAAKYNEALEMKDSCDVRLELINCYEKGLDIGEMSGTYNIFSFVEDTVELYADDMRVYERACELYNKHGRYTECAQMLKKAATAGFGSEKLNACRDEIKYRYKKYYSMYSEVLPAFGGVHTVLTNGGTYTFLNENGTVKLNTGYTMASPFSEGYSLVSSISPNGEERTFLINGSGERQAYFDGVTMSSGVGRAVDASGQTQLLLACLVGDRYKYFDINGNEMFGDYPYAGRFRNNAAAVMTEEGEWYFINGSGERIREETFTDVILNEFSDCAPKGLIFAAGEDGKYRLYNTSLERISDFTCDNARAFVDGYAAVQQGDKWGYIDTEGNVVIEPQYEDAHSFSCGYGAVKSGEQYSFITVDNEVVFNESFDDIGYMNSQGVCFVKSKGHWQYIKMYYVEG